MYIHTSICPFYVGLPSYMHGSKPRVIVPDVWEHLHIIESIALNTTENKIGCIHYKPVVTVCVTFCALCAWGHFKWLEDRIQRETNLRSLDSGGIRTCTSTEVQDIDSNNLYGVKTSMTVRQPMPCTDIVVTRHALPSQARHYNCWFSAAGQVDPIQLIAVTDFITRQLSAHPQPTNQ